MRKVIASVIAVVGMTVLAGSASASIDTKVHANNLRLCNNRCVVDSVTVNVP